MIGLFFGVPGRPARECTSIPIDPSGQKSLLLPHKPPPRDHYFFPIYFFRRRSCVRNSDFLGDIERRVQLLIPSRSLLSPLYALPSQQYPLKKKKTSRITFLRRVLFSHFPTQFTLSQKRRKITCFITEIQLHKSKMRL